MLAAPGGKIYAATGPNGQVWSVDAQGKGQKLFEGKDLCKNMQCLAASRNGAVYAGSDDKGLVVAIDPAKKTSRVLLTAPEKEVSAIVAAADGNVYVATSDSSKGGEAGGESAEPGPRPPQSMPTITITPGTISTKPTTKPAPDAAPASSPASAASGDGEEPSTAAGPTPGPGGATPPAASRGPHPAAPGGPSGETAAEGTLGLEGPGNAVYRIAPDGLVRPVIRRPVSIYAMIQQGDELLLGTGASGQIIAVKTSGDESTIAADTEASQITCLLTGEGGGVYFGSANKGSVGLMASQTAKTGTYVSKPIDAQQIAKWGTIRVRAEVPEKATLTVATRTGNLGEARDDTWSAWSAEIPVTGDFMRIASPAGRFMEYRLTFAAGNASPRATDIRVIYQVGNLAPEIASLTVTPSAAEEGGPGTPPSAGPSAPPGAPGGAKPAETAVPTVPQYFRAIVVQATDPNSDTLSYTFEYRPLGAKNWIKVADKLDKPQYTWDSRTVSDGTYEFRVTVSDLPSNPPALALTATKVSTPVVVNNTPPTVKELAAKVAGGVVSVSGLAASAGSRIASIYYSVDSATDWTMILPEGGICDSDKEKFSFEAQGPQGRLPPPDRQGHRLPGQYWIRNGDGGKTVARNMERSPYGSRRRAGAESGAVAVQPQLTASSRVVAIAWDCETCGRQRRPPRDRPELHKG